MKCHQMSSQVGKLGMHNVLKVQYSNDWGLYWKFSVNSMNQFPATGTLSRALIKGSDHHAYLVV